MRAPRDTHPTCGHRAGGLSKAARRGADGTCAIQPPAGIAGGQLASVVLRAARRSGSGPRSQWHPEEKPEPILDSPERRASCHQGSGYLHKGRNDWVEWIGHSRPDRGSAGSIREEPAANARPSHFPSASSAHRLLGLRPALPQRLSDPLAPGGIELLPCSLLRRKLCGLRRRRLPFRYRRGCLLRDGIAIHADQLAQR